MPACAPGCENWRLSGAGSAIGACYSCCAGRGTGEPQEAQAALSRGTSPGSPSWRSQKGSRNKGSADHAAGAEPALVAQLRELYPDRQPPVRMLAVVDDFTRECLTLVADTLLSGVRVGRELDAVIA